MRPQRSTVFRCHLSHSGLFRYVRGDKKYLSVTAQFPGRLLACLFVDLGYHDPQAFLQKAQCNCLPYSLAAACHDGHPVLHLHVSASL